MGHRVGGSWARALLLLHNLGAPSRARRKGRKEWAS